MMMISFGLQVGQLDNKVRDRLLSLLEPAAKLQQQMAQTSYHWHQRWLIASQGAERLAQLERQVVSLELQQQSVQQLQKENDLLREALRQRPSPTTITAQFYGSKESWFINAGLQEGIQVGDVVLHEGVLIGVVENSYDHYSQVATVVEQDWRLPVKIQNYSDVVSSRLDEQSAQNQVVINEQAIINDQEQASDASKEAAINTTRTPISNAVSTEPIGLWQTARGFTEVTQVPQTFRLATGAAILTLGTEVVPPHLPVGKVQSWHPHPDGATWQITVELYWPLSRIHTVEVRHR